MANRVVVGTQWGDEGKGKIVDILTEGADIVARFSGGANAGHTVVIDDKTFILHLIPTGILHPDKICVIGNGVVVDLEYLFYELDELKKRKIRFQDRLLISQNAHLVMPYHKVIERTEEEARGKEKIDPTGKGIGPTYRDKIARSGLRVIDLLDQNLFHRRVEWNLRTNHGFLKQLNRKELISLKRESLGVSKFKRRVKPFVADTSLFINQAIKEGKSVLFEGAQGALLDIDFGTYPFCTSSNTTVGGACTGLGVSPACIDQVIGVTKAYTTRVGNGPLPTEQKNDVGALLQTGGNEFGATTGRPRRCGWLDLVMLKYSFRINGITKIALTKLDVLDAFDKIKVCVGYKYKNRLITEFTPDLHILENCKPVYEELPGWQKNTHGITDFKDLPGKAKKYLDYISEKLETPIFLISTGSKRDQTILL
ncbi:MAG: adenylosuccinate synthetase [candidate division Zixibacteria bacterium SM1_73]|nr:MAG: adenylosuccinate synthetase [candidate division Zixibacteria bacterium SM1_73]